MLWLLSVVVEAAVVADDYLAVCHEPSRHVAEHCHPSHLNHLYLCHLRWGSTLRNENEKPCLSQTDPFILVCTFILEVILVDAMTCYDNINDIVGF